MPVIKDKTLVAWVYPANLTQRGGSVLTLDDMESHFDGIVFGKSSRGSGWRAAISIIGRTRTRRTTRGDGKPEDVGAGRDRL